MRAWARTGLVANAILAIGLTASTSSCRLPNTSAVKQGGPLRGFPEHGYVVPARAGRVFTDGFDVVRLQGPRPPGS
jgi:hypothetical protein